jgi:hypothetical protein
MRKKEKAKSKAECYAMAQQIVDSYWDSELHEADMDDIKDCPDPNPFTAGTRQHRWFQEAYDAAIRESMELN